MSSSASSLIMLGIAPFTSVNNNLNKSLMESSLLAPNISASVNDEARKVMICFRQLLLIL